ncbi:hypothetical protein U1Q18_020925 [Sarracenia purpurea var. burkii]
MYGHNNSLIGYAATDFVGHFPLLDLPAPPPNLPPIIPTGTEFDPAAAAALPKSEVSYSSSGSSSYGSPSSRASVSPSLIQRSASSVSLQKNINGFLYQMASTSLAEFMGSESGPIRRVFSTGDLQVKYHKVSEVINCSWDQKPDSAINIAYNQN